MTHRPEGGLVQDEAGEKLDIDDHHVGLLSPTVVPVSQTGSDEGNILYYLKKLQKSRHFLVATILLVCLIYVYVTTQGVPQYES